LSALLSTILSLPDDQRVAVERELAPLARSAALGDLAADIAHDVANPLFGVLGLVELLLEDTATGSEDEDRLRLLRQTALEMKATLRVLLDFARAPDGEPAEASLPEAVRRALELLRHGVGRSIEVDERYAAGSGFVPCPPSALVQAVLQLLLAARETGRIEIEVADGSLRISPSPSDSLGALVATRIAVDHGGAVERTEDSLTLRWLG
jgi:signal transduction histidine kinase